MIKNNVTISVCIPVYERCELLKKTLASVFAQTVPPNEVIIVDNYSTDGTWELLQKYKNRIRLYRNSKNMGSLYNFNRAAKLAKSKYVVMLGSDDILLPDYIKDWKETISNATDDIAVFTSPDYHIDPEDRIIVISNQLPGFSHDVILEPRKSLRYFWGNGIFHILQGGHTVIKNKVLQDIGYFHTNHHRMAEHDCTMQILSTYRIYYSAKVNFCYRIHTLQAYEKKVGDFTQYDYYIDWLNAVAEYENNPAVKNCFSKKEQKQRYYIRVAYFNPFINCLLRFLAFDKSSAFNYFTLFRKYYPKPYFSLFTLYLFWYYIKRISRQLHELWEVRQKGLYGINIVQKYNIPLLPDNEKNSLHSRY